MLHLMQAYLMLFSQCVRHKDSVMIVVRLNIEHCIKQAQLRAEADRRGFLSSTDV